MSVVNGVIQHLSVSQIKTYNTREYGGCRRRWYYSKVVNLPEPTTAAQAQGTDVHAQIEHYLTTGENVLSGIALAGKHLLPEPGKDLLIEQEFGAVGLSAAGIPLKGFIDVVNPRSAPVYRVTDHKTTSDFKYAKTPEILEKDTQMLGYGVWVSLRYPDVTDVILEHIYYRTRGAKAAISVETTQPIETVKKRWYELVEPVAEEMKVTALAPKASDVPKNTEACDAYRGCPFRGRCLADDLTSLKVRAPTMSILDDLKGLGNGNVAANSGAPPGTGQGDIPSPSADRSVGSAPVAILPPDAPAFDAPLEPEVAAPKKRGRPKKALAAEAAAAVEATPGTGDRPPPPPSEPAVQGDSTDKAEAPGLAIFVNCVPNRHYVDLAQYVAALTATLEKTYSCPDIRVSEANELKFGKWKGCLAALARANPPPPACYVAFSEGSELQQIVIEALVPFLLPGGYTRGIR